MNHMPATKVENETPTLRGPRMVIEDQVLPADALAFLSALERNFGRERRALLSRRQDIQAMIDQGWSPDFNPETADIRNADWTVAETPADLLDRRVEITGPPERKMIINALNSGASVFMADFEDSLSPTWSNLLEGQINLRDAVAGTISVRDEAKQKDYALNAKTAVLIVRPRGWHLEEDHVLVDGVPMSASLFDFGLYLFHNAETLKRKGTGPYFYLPKMENHLEARLWHDVFAFAEEFLGLAHGTIKATVLIETILAAFEMDEILFELKDYIVGLNCGRWDYIFSMVKKFRNRSDYIMPDRADVTMTSHALRSYSQLLIKTCHRRGAHAIGGMAAQIPIKGDDAANGEAMDRVRADKLREAEDGHDGTWVAHPGLVAIAREIFDKRMPGPNQIFRAREDVDVSAQDLLALPKGKITESGLRTNIRVGLQYLEAWLRGSGCVPLYNLMEDAATAEISRAQIWQWLTHTAILDDGRAVTEPLITRCLQDELDALSEERGVDITKQGRFAEAAELFMALSTAVTFDDFLTLPAYRRLTQIT